MGELPAHGTLAGAVVWPYTLSSQSSTIISFDTGMRANTRMVYLSSRAGSIYNDEPSCLEAHVFIILFCNRFHIIVGCFGGLSIVLMF